MLLFHEIHSSGIINLGGAEVLTLKNIVEIIAKKLGVEPVFEFSHGEPKHLVGDTKSLNQLIPQKGFKSIKNIEMDLFV